MDLVEPGGEDGAGTGSGKESQATILVRLSEVAGVKPFHDDRGDTWVVLPVDRHLKEGPFLRNHCSGPRPGNPPTAVSHQ